MYNLVKMIFEILSAFNFIIIAYFLNGFFRNYRSQNVKNTYNSLVENCKCKCKHHRCDKSEECKKINNFNGYCRCNVCSKRRWALYFDCSCLHECINYPSKCDIEHTDKYDCFKNDYKCRKSPVRTVPAKNYDDLIDNTLDDDMDRKILKFMNIAHNDFTPRSNMVGVY
jgi:hypothetical protein